MKELKQIYFNELKKRTLETWKEEVASGVVTKHEMEEEILSYYRRTVASLQEFYSKYTPEWEAFTSSEHLSLSAFMDFVRQMRMTFRKRYRLSEFNVDYYLNEWKKTDAGTPDAEVLKQLFLDRWYQVLSDKEYHYQYQHIVSLCSAFPLLERKKGLRTDRNQQGERFQWLLHNYPQLHERILPYQEEISRNPVIQQLVALLGKKRRGEKRSFDSFSGIQKTWVERHAPSSDIEGIAVGNDLGKLLPVEYCYLADEVLHPFFLQRYAEKQLQQFEGYSKEMAPVQMRRQEKNGQGPFIVCVDTSGSMQGQRERIAKSAILAIALLTEQTGRMCYVINFSDEAVALKISNITQEIPLLDAFLNKHFDGGTDILPALREAKRVVQAEDFHESDLLLISDFEMPPPTEELQAICTSLKARKSLFYAICFGSRPEREYLSMCEKYWEL